MLNVGDKVVVTNKYADEMPISMRAWIGTTMSVAEIDTSFEVPYYKMVEDDGAWMWEEKMFGECEGYDLRNLLINGRFVENAGGVCGVVVGNKIVYENGKYTWFGKLDKALRFTDSRYPFLTIDCIYDNIAGGFEQISKSEVPPTPIWQRKKVVR